MHAALVPSAWPRTRRSGVPRSSLRPRRRAARGHRRSPASPPGTGPRAARPTRRTRRGPRAGCWAATASARSRRHSLDANFVTLATQHVVHERAVLLRTPPFLQPREQRLTNPPRARAQQLGPLVRTGEHGVDHDAVGIVHVQLAFDTERAIHLTSQRPAEPGRLRAHLVEGALPA